LDTLNRSELDKRKVQEERYRQMYNCYYREHKQVSQVVEYGMGFGLLALSVAYMALSLRRRRLM
jgi:hypothetical protein